MQTLKARIVFVSALTLQVGCGWQSKSAFYSPDRSKLIELRQPWIDSSLGIEIDFVEAHGKRRYRLLKAGETNVTWAFVHWASTGKSVSLVICGTREVRLAYDLSRHTMVPFETFRKEMDSKILDVYGVDEYQGSARSPSQCIGDFYSSRFQSLYKSGRTDGT